MLSLELSIAHEIWTPKHTALAQIVAGLQPMRLVCACRRVRGRCLHLPSVRIVPVVQKCQLLVAIPREQSRLGSQIPYLRLRQQLAAARRSQGKSIMALSNPYIPFVRSSVLQKASIYLNHHSSQFINAKSACGTYCNRGVGMARMRCNGVVKEPIVCKSIQMVCSTKSFYSIYGAL